MRSPNLQNQYEDNRPYRRAFAPAHLPPWTFFRHTCYKPDDQLMNQPAIKNNLKPIRGLTRPRRHRVLAQLDGITIRKVTQVLHT